MAFTWPRNAARRALWFAREQVIRAARLHWRLPTGLVLRVESFSDWAVLCCVFGDREYDAAIARTLAGSEGRAPVVLDLGANTGFFTLRFLDQLFHERGTDADYFLLLVEGSPDNAAVLRRRVPQDARLRVMNALVGRRDGVDTIFENRFGAASSAMVDFGSWRRRGGVEMAYLDLDAMMPGGGMIDLVKCDIEGSEEIFVETYGALLARTRMLVMEFHGDVVDVPRCHGMLAACGLVPTMMVRADGDQSVVCFERAPALAGVPQPA